MNHRARKKLPRRLCTAAEEGRTGALQHLLRHGADPNQRRPDGATPLYLAAVQGHPRCVQLLLQAGADPNTESHGPRCGLPLCAAAAHANIVTTGLLLAHGADPERKEHHGTGGNALQWARGWTDEAAYREVEALLKHT
ncbi:ankyrin repeat domain-containing protein [Streptomyces noursei]|uniref:ankyrin repeat domain-containing protein n=1 Tax=Streptomyces noursei TaxID=1971 RepID=UPI00344BBDF7